MQLQFVYAKVNAALCHHILHSSHLLFYASAILKENSMSHGEFPVLSFVLLSQFWLWSQIQIALNFVAHQHLIYSALILLSFCDKIKMLIQQDYDFYKFSNSQRHIL